MCAYCEEIQHRPSATCLQLIAKNKSTFLAWLLLHLLHSHGFIHQNRSPLIDARVDCLLFLLLMAILTVVFYNHHSKAISLL